jgi:hypothetical protein
MQCSRGLCGDQQWISRQLSTLMSTISTDFAATARIAA